MARIYWPPLLRGIGTTFILLGSLIAIFVARQDDASFRPKGQPVGLQSLSVKQPVATGKPVATNMGEAEPVEENKDVAEEVFENPYFAWMGFAGTAIIASSFYVETFVRRSKNT